MQSKRPNLWMIMTCQILTGIISAGCDETQMNDDGLQTTAFSQPNGPVIIIPCNPTSVTADAVLSTPPTTANSVRSISPGDTYAESNCAPYIVEFTYHPISIGASWDHNASQAECAGLQMTLDTYTFNGTWSPTSHSVYSGIWSVGRCLPAIDLDVSVPPSFGSGTKWRAAAYALTTNCTSTCYNDFKRIVISDSIPPG